MGYTCTQDVRALTTMDKLIDSLLNISSERYIHTYMHVAKLIITQNEIMIT